MLYSSKTASPVRELSWDRMAFVKLFLFRPKQYSPIKVAYDIPEYLNIVEQYKKYHLGNYKKYHLGIFSSHCT